MKNKLNLKNNKSEKFFQINLFLDEKEAMYIHDLEEIIRKDNIYSLIRKLIYIHKNYYILSPKETEFYDKNSYIYNDFLYNIFQILDISVEHQIAKDFFLENNKPLNLNDLAQIAKWEKSDESELKKGSVFIVEEEFKNFQNKFNEAIKTKQEFFDAHSYLYLEKVWMLKLKNYPIDMIELSAIGKFSLNMSINVFLKQLERIENEWVKKKDVIKYSRYVRENEECFFEECEYAEVLLDEYFRFLENSRNNIRNFIFDYFMNQINHIVFSKEK